MRRSRESICCLGLEYGVIQTFLVKDLGKFQNFSHFPLGVETSFAIQFVDLLTGSFHPDFLDEGILGEKEPVKRQQVYPTYILLKAGENLNCQPKFAYHQ